MKALWMFAAGAGAAWGADALAKGDYWEAGWGVAAAVFLLIAARQQDALDAMHKDGGPP